MRRFSLLSAMLATVLTAAPNPPDAPDAAGDFRRLRSLVGEWKGTVEWSGARTDRGEMNATYSETGHGTAVVENLISGGEAVMTSVYHRDGPRLRMTHFCGAGNQPRLRSEPSGDPRLIRFVFVDATSLGDPPGPHVDGVELLFVDPTHLELTFHFVEPRGASRERISLTRISGDPAWQS